MSFEKKGTPNKIQKITANDKIFEETRKKIAEDNNLVRCKNCSKLLSKKSEDNSTVDLQHKHLSMIIKDAGFIKIQCPACNQINEI